MIISIGKKFPEGLFIYKKMGDIGEDFKGFLIRKALSENTIKQYMQEFKTFYKYESQLGFNQQTVDAYIQYAGRAFNKRAFMKNYIKFRKRPELEIQELTGRRPKPKQKFISKKQMESIYLYLLKKHSSIKYYLMVRLAYECGLRRSEVISILPDDFDWDTWVENPEDKCRLNVHGKGAKDRTVIVKSDTTKEIAKYLKEQYIPNPDSHNRSRNIWKMRESRFSQVFKDAVTDLGIDGSLHTLRHSRATEWSRSGVRIEIIKNRMGHEDISNTQRYINPDLEKELQDWEEE